MITQEQEEWLEHLAPGHLVKIVPYNPHIKQAFTQIKTELQSLLGSKVEIQHRGASSMGISGKGDLDIHIPVSPNDFSTIVHDMEERYGKPGSFYKQQRARWNMSVMGFETEVFVVNADHPAWAKTILFEDFLSSHPEELERYRILKETAEGLDIRDYYRAKLEFFNEILQKASGNL